MDTLRALELRHSVRSYKDTILAGDVLAKLEAAVAAANKASGLHIQLVTDEPKAFSGLMPRYGSFKQVHNYFALVGKKNAAEDLGYYGQQLVLEAQKLGLNTCWVALTFSKRKVPCDIRRGEKLHGVIAVGYGVTQGNPHKSKPLSALVNGQDLPAWFEAGAKAAQLSPTAMNKQSFTLSLDKKERVVLKLENGSYTGLDTGIVKYNFEVGAASKGHKVTWA